MANDIRESDWKLFKEVRAAALERFCEGILAEVADLAGDQSKGSHERYLLVYGLIKERDALIADAFNDLRRSTMLRQLGFMWSLELVTDEEFARFSPEAQGAATIWAGG